MLPESEKVVANGLAAVEGEIFRLSRFTIDFKASPTIESFFVWDWSTVLAA